MARTFSYIAKCLLFSMLFLVAIAINAAELKRIYEFETPIQETGGFDQAKMIQKSFEQVLIRASGSEKILQSEAIQKAIAESDKFVKQLSYHQGSKPERTLKIIFNENLINQLLKTSHQPILQKYRPIVLVWVALERDHVSRWIGPDTESSTAQEIQLALNKRAIPFMFPLLDLTDTSSIIEEELWKDNFQSLIENAKRYNPDVILLGRIRSNGNRWQGQWTLIKDKENVVWINKGEEINNVLNDMIEELTNQLANTHVVITNKKDQGEINHLSLSVIGILNAEQYTRVLEYLRRLPVVKAVEVSEIMSDKTTFDLQTTATKGSLIQTIAEEQLLVRHSVIEAGELSHTLAYKIAEAP